MAEEQVPAVRTLLEILLRQDYRLRSVAKIYQIPLHKGPPILREMMARLVP